eukprot:1013204-Pyramimonas_sp.AAC.1
MRGGTLAALAAHREPLGGPWRELPRRASRSQAMGLSLENLASFCWLRRPPWRARSVRGLH